MQADGAESATVRSWLAETRPALDAAREAGWSDFVEQYEEVMRAADTQLADLGERIGVLLGGSADLRQQDFLAKYVEVMSVKVHDRDVFLPSFSDQCLWEVVKGRASGLSPFRGLYYSWRLSEIAVLLQRPRKMASAFKRLREVLDASLEVDYLRQTSAVNEYRRYEQDLRTNGSSSEWTRHVEYAKFAVRMIAAPFKWRWIHVLPYPCLTSTHFYMSGIRFYHNAHIGGATAADFTTADRYCVQSTDSGLALPFERYGMLLPPDADPDIANELLAEIPPGSLLLDLSTAAATADDCDNLRYFENWSRLITAKAYALVTETLSLHACTQRRGSTHRSGLYDKLARANFLNALTKNPMRTFYFDTGIFGAARLAMRSGLPKVQYVTTRRTKIGTGRTDPGRQMLDRLFAEFGDGIKFYLANDTEWPNPTMATWTLVPTGDRLASKTSCLWSIRGRDSRKITHGMEGLRRDAFLGGLVSPGELALESLEALVGGAVGGALVPSQVILGVVLGGAVATGASAIHVNRDVHRVLDEIAEIGRSPNYRRIREAKDVRRP